MKTDDALDNWKEFERRFYLQLREAGIKAIETGK